MSEVIKIYEAKTNLSKLVKKAQAGETIYIGAYGHAQAVISPLPASKPLKIGVWAHKKIGYKDKDIVGPDPAITKLFEDSKVMPDGSF